MSSWLYKIVLLPFWLVVSIACSDDANSPESAVTGTVDFAEPVDLGSLTSAHIKLVDVSIADAAEVVISEQIIGPIDAVPILFSVGYAAEQIDPSKSYSIAAAVSEANDFGVDVRAFVTTQSYPVLTKGFGDEVNVLVERLDSADTMVTGTLDFAEPVDLGRLVKARIQLVDNSIADAPVVVISEQVVEPITALPVLFSINYPVEAIVPSNSYAIFAAVYEVNNLGEEVRAFITTQAFAVLTRGFDDEINVVVERIN